MYYIFLAFISFTFVGFSESWNEQKSTTTIINKREVREKEKVFEKTLLRLNLFKLREITKRVERKHDFFSFKIIKYHNFILL